MDGHRSLRSEQRREKQSIPHIWSEANALQASETFCFPLFHVSEDRRGLVILLTLPWGM